MLLTETQLNLINKIAKDTKQDEWFSIREKKSCGVSSHYVYDTVYGKKRPLNIGILWLIDTCTDEYLLSLSTEDKLTLIRIVTNTTLPKLTIGG